MPANPDVVFGPVIVPVASSTPTPSVIAHPAGVPDPVTPAGAIDWADTVNSRPPPVRSPTA